MCEFIRSAHIDWNIRVYLWPKLDYSILRFTIELQIELDILQHWAGTNEGNTSSHQTCQYVFATCGQFMNYIKSVALRRGSHFVRGLRSKEFWAIHNRKQRFWNDPNDGFSLESPAMSRFRVGFFSWREHRKVAW